MFYNIFNLLKHYAKSSKRAFKHSDDCELSRISVDTLTTKSSMESDEYFHPHIWTMSRWCQCISCWAVLVLVLVFRVRG